MEELRQYLLRVITAALICAVVQTFQHGAASKGLTKLVCGLIMAMTVIAPFQDLSLSGLPEPILPISNMATASAEAGEQMSRSALTDIIKSETEAYILDKANEMGIRIDVDVTVSNETIPVPESAIIRGNIPEQDRNSLREILSSHLGIAKENLTWIG